MTDIIESLKAHRERASEISASARKSTTQLSKLNTDMIMLNGLAGSISGEDVAGIRSQMVKTMADRVSEVLNGPQ